MASIKLVDSSIASLKNALREKLPAVKSCHLSEALAFGLGYGTHASLLTAMKGAENVRPIVYIDARRLLTRLHQFGYTKIFLAAFEGLRLAEIPGIKLTDCPHSHQHKDRTDEQESLRDPFGALPSRTGINSFGLPIGSTNPLWASGIPKASLPEFRDPMRESMQAFNSGYRYSDFLAPTWNETYARNAMRSSFSHYEESMKPMRAQFASTSIEPMWFGDRSRLIM